MSPWAIGALVGAAVVGCGRDAQLEQILGARHVVDEVAFEGVTRFDHEALLGFLAIDEDPLIGKSHYYLPGSMPAEARRIEAAYHAVGHFEARVVDVRAAVDDAALEVDLVFVVDEGPVTRVERTEWRWLDADAVDPDTRARIEALDRLAVEAPFEVARLNATVADARLALQQSGFPFAAVTERPVVDRAQRRAEVTYSASAGPRATIGDIALIGLGDIPEEPVREAVAFAAGKRYSPALVERVEAAVYGMNVFRSVVAVLDPSVNAAGRLGLTLRLDPARPQSLELGVGIAIDPGNWEAVLQARYSHSNVFGELSRLTLHGEVGYAFLPSPFDVDQSGVVGEGRLALERKGLFERGLVWTLGMSFESDIEDDYSYRAIEPYVRVSRFFTRRVEVALTYRLRFVDYYEVLIDADFEEEDFEDFDFEAVDVELEDLDLDEFIEFDDGYRLSVADVTLKLFLTDRVLKPRNGVVFDLKYALAGGLLGGSYDYHTVKVGARSYWTPWSRLRVLGRAGLGVISPFAGTQAWDTPTDQRLFLGGSNSVRGWGLNNLSPQIDDECEEAFFDLNAPCAGLPVGGHTSVMASGEVQGRLFGDFWLAGFVDMGDVRALTLDFAPDEWNYSAGGGVRVGTPVGKVRLDVGVRLNNPPRFVHEQRWALHFGLGDDF